jgi:hypothetical protein
MINKENNDIKKAWQKPAIVCLSVNKTEAGDPGDVYDDIDYARLS